VKLHGISALIVSDRDLIFRQFIMEGIIQVARHRIVQYTILNRMVKWRC